MYTVALRKKKVPGEIFHARLDTPRRPSSLLYTG